MTKRLRVPDESRFVRAFALAVDPGDTLGLLMEIGALGSPDIGIVRRTREALLPTYDRASDLKDWDQAHTASVLREGLAQSDSAAYLAYHVRTGHGHQTAHSTTEYADALAFIGCAADTLGFRRRPWDIEGNDLSLPEWRQRVRKLLFAIPGTALPRPAAPSPPSETGCTCSEPGSPTDTSDEHASWCPAGMPAELEEEPS
jgi:hypothetical protein